MKSSAAENYTDMAAPCSSACAGVPGCLSEVLTKAAGGVGRETNLRRSADNTVRLGHEYGYCVVGRGGRENED